MRHMGGAAAVLLAMSGTALAHDCPAGDARSRDGTICIELRPGTFFYDDAEMGQWLTAMMPAVLPMHVWSTKFRNVCVYVPGGRTWVYVEGNSQCEIEAPRDEGDPPRCECGEPIS